MSGHKEFPPIDHWIAISRLKDNKPVTSDTLKRVFKPFGALRHLFKWMGATNMQYMLLAYETPEGATKAIEKSAPLETLWGWKITSLTTTELKHAYDMLKKENQLPTKNALPSAEQEILTTHDGTDEGSQASVFKTGIWSPVSKMPTSPNKPSQNLSYSSNAVEGDANPSEQDESTAQPFVALVPDVTTVPMIVGDARFPIRPSNLLPTGHPLIGGSTTSKMPLASRSNQIFAQSEMEIDTRPSQDHRTSSTPSSDATDGWRIDEEDLVDGPSPKTPTQTTARRQREPLFISDTEDDNQSTNTDDQSGTFKDISQFEISAKQKLIAFDEDLTHFVAQARQAARDLQVSQDEIHQRDLRIQQLEALYQERDAQCREMDGHLQDREARLHERRTQLYEREVELQQKDAQLQEKDVMCREKDALIQQLVIQSQEHVLAITGLETQLQEEKAERVRIENAAPLIVQAYRELSKAADEFVRTQAQIPRV